jgi:hypothetical protein
MEHSLVFDFQLNGEEHHHESRNIEIKARFDKCFVNGN